jgi:ABC-type amino acid transport substrate-binding protein
LRGRAKVAEFTQAMSYRPAFVYARADDVRFDNDYKKIDDPAVKISVIEGQAANLFAMRQFPKTGFLIMPTLTDLTQNEMNVADGKADLSLSEASTAERFMAANPGKLRRVAGPPLIAIADTLQVGVGEEALKSLLNTTLDHLAALRFIAQTHEKYLGAEGNFYVLPKAAGQ